MISLSDVKTALTISTSGEEATLSGYIINAYKSLPFQYDATSGVITESAMTTDTGYFYIKAKTGSCTIDKIEILEDFIYTEIDVNEAKQIKKNKYYIPYYNSYIRITYTPDNFLEPLDEIIKDVIVWNYNRQLNKEGNLIKNTAVVGDANLNYKTDKQFNDEIKVRINNLFSVIGL